MGMTVSSLLSLNSSLSAQINEDNAVGHLEEIGKGRLAVTRVRLDPVIVFGGETPDAETIRKLHHQSHEDCFIANSVTTEIIV